jgi:hypothetical protein
LGLALDEPNDAEIIYSENGVTIVGDARLQGQLRTSGGASIDFAPDGRRGRGFMVLLNNRNGDCGC